MRHGAEAGAWRAKIGAIRPSALGIPPWWVAALAAVLLSAPSALSQTSYIVTLTESSSPANLFTTVTVLTNYPPGSPEIDVQTLTAPMVIGGYHFTEWTLNGQRAQDETGMAVNPAPVVFTNDISAVANYVRTTNYTADNQVPDWYKIMYFNTTNITASANPSGDGFSIGYDYFNGYDPLLFNQVVDGGISRRRSAMVSVTLNTNYSTAIAISSPLGLYNSVEVLSNGMALSLLAQPAATGYGFIGWFVGTNRVDDPNGFSTGTLNCTVTSNTTFVAEFLPVSQDTDHDGLPDWYQMYYFGTLTNSPLSYPSGDGFDIATDYQRGYQPNVFNQVIDGGISRRRSAVVSVTLNTNYSTAIAISSPLGLYDSVEVLSNGMAFSLPARPAATGYGFIGWFVGTNRMDDPNGFSAGTILYPVTSNMTFVAEFLPISQDTNNDGLPDWFQMYYFNTLTNSPLSNLSGDGFDIATDYHRGYQPNVFNQVVDGGISRRRSPALLFVPAPPGIAAPPQDQTVQPGTDVTVAVTPQGIGPFTCQWLLNGIALVGATNSSLTITNAQPANGGSFSVRVFNSYGWIESPPGRIVVECPDLALADDFYAAPLYYTNSFTGSGNNTGATEQDGEPGYERGEGGRHSVWMAWQGTAPGIVSFDTLGSSFDTVLAVFTNSTGMPLDITNLAPVAADDDGGGFLTSQAQFNVIVGQTYYVLMDGFDGAAGNIVLGWQFIPTNALLPQIFQQPLPVVTGLGQTVSFSVVAAGSNLAYQWYVDGAPIADATNAALTLQNIQTTDVGNYTVQVSNGDETVQSLPAFLQINSTDGTVQQVAAVYKLGEVVTLAPPAPAPHIRAHDIAGAPVPGFSGTQVLSTAATPSQAAWFCITAPTDGNMLVTTEGSGFPTLLTIYSGPPNAIETSQLTLMTQAANTGYDHLTSRLACTVTSNQTYYAAVAGAQGASGHVAISWEIPYQQALQLPPTNQPPGSATLAIQTTNQPPQDVQWFFDQHALPGATNLTLVLSNIVAADQGFYSVSITGSDGLTNRDLVYLQVLPLLLDAQYVPGNNAVLLHFGTTSGRAVQILASSNLVDWAPIYTNSAPGITNSFTNALSPGQGPCFYQFSFP